MASKPLFQLLAVACIAGLSACAGSTSKGTSHLPDAQTAAVRTYASYCSRCHALPHPGRHGAAEWSAVMDIMLRRMRERKLVLPSHDQQQTILRYLETHAR